MVDDRTAAVGMSLSPCSTEARRSNIGRLLFCTVFGLVLSLLTASPVKATSKPAQVFDILTEAGFLSDDGNGGSFGGASARGLRMEEVDMESALVSIVGDPDTIYDDTSSMKICAARLDGIYFSRANIDLIAEVILLIETAAGLTGDTNKAIFKNILYALRAPLAFAYCLSLSDNARPNIDGVIRQRTRTANTQLGTSIWAWLSGTTEGKKISGLLAQTDVDDGVAYLKEWGEIIRRQTVAVTRSTLGEQMADGMTNKVLVPLNNTVFAAANEMATELSALITAFQNGNVQEKEAALYPFIEAFKNRVSDIAAPFYEAYFGYRFGIPDRSTGYTNKVFQITFQDDVNAIDTVAQLVRARVPAGWFGVYGASSATIFTPAAPMAAAKILSDIKSSEPSSIDDTDSNNVAELQQSDVADIADLSVVLRGKVATDVAEILEEGETPKAAAFPKMLYNKYAVTLPAVALVFATYVAL